MTTTTTARSSNSSSSSREGKGTARGDDEEEEDGFRGVRDHLLSSGRLFAERAKEARGLIAGTARKFVRDGGTVLTAGRSRVVGAVLAAAAEAGTRFRVVYVRDGADAITSTKGTDMVEQLRRKGIPVAVIAPEAAAYSLGQVTSVMVGAEGVVENGGVISRMGTYQLAMLAKSAGKPFHVVAESHKFVRLYPLGHYDLPIRQTVLEFREADSEKVKDGEGASGGGREGEDDEGAVDYTPPELITALVTEVGVHTPTAVSEELIKIWY